MELRHLRYFIVVAEELNFRRAAARLNISHPPLSRQLQDLEHEIGVKLMERGKRGVSLTDAGQNFLMEARLIVAHAAQAVEDARDVPRGKAGRLRIAYSHGYFEPSLARVLKLFRERYPKIKIEIQQLNPDQQMDALRGRLIDLAYVGLRYHQLQDEIHFECVRRAKIQVAFPSKHRLLTHETIALSMLVDEHFVTIGGAFYDYENWLQRLCASAGYKPKISLEADTSSTWFGLISAGFGIAVLPDLHDPPATEVEFRPLKPDLPKFEFNVAWCRDSQSPALQHYIDLL